MAAILRKLRRDLAANRVQRAFIVAMLILATAALTTSLTVQARGGTAWEELFREANGAHAWFYGEDGGALKAVAAHGDIRASAGPYVMTLAEVPSILSPVGRGFPLWLQGVGAEPPGLDRPVLVDGRWVEHDGEVVLSRKFARDNGIEPGDTLTVTTQAGSTTLRVTGIAVFSGRSPFWIPVLAWTTEGTLTGTLAPQFAGVGIQLESRAAAAAFLATVEQELGEDAFLEVQDWNDVRAQNDEATEIIALFLGIFSVFALISAAFVIVNAISGRILARYRDIGLLKAIGFTPRQVTLGLLIEQCGMAVIAVVAGIALGTLLVPLLDDPASREFETSSLGSFRPGLALAIAAGVVGLVALATLLPAWRAGRISSVQAITTGFGRVSSRPSRTAALLARLHCSPSVTTGAKDAFDRPLRSWLTVLALILSVVTVTFVVSTEWTIRQLLDDPALIGEPFEIQVDSGDKSAIESAIKDDPQMDAYFERGTMAVTPDGKEEEVILAAVGPGFEQMDWVITRGRLFEAPGEAVAGYGFLQLMDADVGDTVEFEVLGKTLRVKIVGLFRATEDDGRWLMTSIETARQQLDPQLEVEGFAVRLKDGADAATSAARYRQAATAGASIEVFDHAADGVGAVRGVLVTLAVLLVSVGLVSLVNTIATGVRERQRDIGVLKAIGMTPRQVVLGVVTSAGLLTAIALVVGLPLGIWVSIRITDLMGEGLGWGPGLLEQPPAAWLAAIVPAIAVCALGAALIPALAAARTRPTEVLRNE